MTTETARPSAYARVQKSRGMEEITLGRFMVRVYPNVIELHGEHGMLTRFLPEEWAAIVQVVGIRGLEPA